MFRMARKAEHSKKGLPVIRSGPVTDLCLRTNQMEAPDIRPSIYEVAVPHHPPAVIILPWPM